MFKLTAEQIDLLHDECIKETGGLAGTKDPGYVHLIADKPFMVLYSFEQYPGFFLKAACYMHSIITTHAFFDANKRTGLLCALTFLDLNNYSLDVDWEELFNITILVATNDLSLEELAEYFEKNSIYIGD